MLLERLAASEEERMATDSARDKAERTRKEALTCLEEISFDLIKAEAEFAGLLFGSKGSGQRVAVVRRC